MPRAKILVVGDPDLVRALWLRLRFRANNYEVGTASDAIVSPQKERPAVIILDPGTACGEGFRRPLQNINVLSGVPAALKPMS
jgi:hypothetical protein